ncbi:major facilitator superfamily domain-containing protein [Abortiporus biennis]|nr:major facilitator superfamily domain-containing protein [Abortiporus biennis]
MSTHSSDTLNTQPSPSVDLTLQPQPDIEKNEEEKKQTSEPEVYDTDDTTYKVVLSPEEDPRNLPLLRKWLTVLVISTSALCVTCASSVAAFTEKGVSRDFHVGMEVAILGVSLFVQGLAFGPLLVGPLSEVYGRNIVYRISFLLFFAFTWAVAFPPHIAVYLIFRFLTGFCGASFLSVAGGSVSDMFSGSQVATPMAVFTISPFIGPVVGPLMSGFINQHLNWRWTYRIMLIWTFVQIVGLLLIVPETYHPVLLKKKAQRLRKETGDPKYHCPLDRRGESLVHSIMMSCYVPFKLLLLDRMALLLDVWNALLLGILYLAFQAFPIIFEQGHGFSVQLTGLSFLGLGVGMIIGLASQPLWNRLVRRKVAEFEGPPPPELHLIMGIAGGILTPLSLYWLAFTTYRSVHWIVPIVASVPFGTGILFCFTSTFTYLVVAYQPIAASAMAANTFVRTTFAAAFPLFAGQMYHRLGTVGATALLAGLCTIAAPLPLVFYRIGARLRANSQFTASS